MNVEEFRKIMASGECVRAGSKLFDLFHKYSQEALKITSKLNNKYCSPSEIIELISKLTEQKVDESFRLFPPFYTDCGKNIKIGKRVFINACCRFQDQGGIVIGDDVLIGHNTTIATLNHELNPDRRGDLIPKPVIIGNKVWIGADCTILPGVKIEDGAVVGAASVVTKDVAKNTVVVGSPARVVRSIEC